MNIIYLTTAQDEKEYRSFMNIWRISLNPSNQNFHEKLIRALSINNKVDVISLRPFSHHLTKVRKLDYEVKEIGNVRWHYLKRSGNKIYRTLIAPTLINKEIKKLDYKNSIIITDTINKTIVRSISKLKDKYKIPVIGICTDSPSNITGTRRSYTVYLLEHCADFDGYIALTEGLNNLFNPSGKPGYIFEGIVEDRAFKEKEESKKPYFFFGGALLPRYGVYQLIESFNELKRNDVELLICGHHGDKDRIKLACQGNNNIKYLGILPMNKVMEYEASAIANINPRPFSEDLDRFSIPSKTLEYMVSGRPTISVKNTILQSKFQNEVIWVDSASPKDLKQGLEKALEMTEVERENFGEDAKNRVLALYSLENVSKSIQNFLLQFIKKD